MIQKGLYYSSSNQPTNIRFRTKARQMLLEIALTVQNVKKLRNFINFHASIAKKGVLCKMLK